MTVVEAEAGALLDIAITMSVHILVVILVEEILTDIMGIRVGVGGLEAVVPDDEKEEVEVQWEGTGAQSGRVVLKGELR